MSGYCGLRRSPQGLEVKSSHLMSLVFVSICWIIDRKNTQEMLTDCSKEREIEG